MVEPTKMFARSARMISDIAANPMPIATRMGQWFDYCEKVALEHKTRWK